MTTYIIEHLEPQLWPWAVLEYRHISSFIGYQNLWFTNVKKAAQKLKTLGTVKQESVIQLGLTRVCVLDPKAKKTLTPKDKDLFDYFVFGGILGDYPPKARTGELTKKLKCEIRNLGKEQMSTDTAVNVAKKILDGTPFEKLTFKDKIELDIAPGESVELPYRYLVEKGKVRITPGLKKFLKEQVF